MNDSHPKEGKSAAANLLDLDGRVVLVKTSRDLRNPPAGIRGWIEVHEKPGETPQLSVVVEFPQMFSTRAHHRAIRLNESTLAQLLASEHNGVFEFTIDDELK